ncbi:putative Inositol hexaphosphate kinase 1 [Paratrimastix pyriformis]|uniref:Kinase n=1 Tax=Paratrimastix pyriformis TaxID=342808 RepID=A0ABQ8UHC7_9EUKA|nr:putative Inositol hexaphosphate kinase 1 [Paratrimastix pyriformis]
MIFFWSFFVLVLMPTEPASQGLESLGIAPKWQNRKNACLRDSVFHPQPVFAIFVKTGAVHTHLYDSQKYDAMRPSLEKLAVDIERDLGSDFRHPSTLIATIGSLPQLFNEGTATEDLYWTVYGWVPTGKIDRSPIYLHCPFDYELFAEGARQFFQVGVRSDLIEPALAALAEVHCRLARTRDPSIGGILVGVSISSDLGETAPTPRARLRAHEARLAPRPPSPGCHPRPGPGLVVAQAVGELLWALHGALMPPSPVRAGKVPLWTSSPDAPPRRSLSREEILGLMTIDDAAPTPVALPGQPRPPRPVQAGGHEGVFRRHPDPARRGALLKRAEPAEVAFYAQARAAHTQFLRFVPRVEGAPVLLPLTGPLPKRHHQPDQTLAGPAEAGGPGWVAYLEMEDLTAGYRRACVLDVKLGTRTYGPFAGPEKVASQQGKADRTTGSTLGLRLAGAKLWDRSAGVYRSLSRQASRSLTDREALLAALRLFFEAAPAAPAAPSSAACPVSPRVRIVRQVCEQIAELLRFAAGQAVYRFYASSVLVIYEGDPEAAEGAPVRVRHIDFAHAHRFQDYPGMALPDDGLQWGLQNLLELLGQVGELAEAEAEQVPSPSVAQL